jgi:hypothetical protein
VSVLHTIQMETKKYENKSQCKYKLFLNYSNKIFDIFSNLYDKRNGQK